MTIYSEHGIFEEIIFDPDRFPNWNRIATHYADVCLNLSEDELDVNLQEGEILFEFVKASGGRVPNALKPYFDEVYSDQEQILLHPRDVFILSLKPENAQAMSVRYGMIIESEDDLNDDILTSPTLTRDLIQDQRFENGTDKGWRVALDVPLPPSNSLVIIDPYILTDRHGHQNTLDFLDACLPPEIGIPYHVTIIGNPKNEPNNEAWRNQVAGDLNAGINTLRPYDIHVEVVFQKSEYYHKRRTCFNYALSKMDKGYSVFRSCRVTVKNDNEMEVLRSFSNIEQHGDKPFDQMTHYLERVRTETDRLAAHIDAGHTSDLGSIKGACKPNKQLNNRLVRDV